MSEDRRLNLCLVEDSEIDATVLQLMLGDYADLTRVESVCEIPGERFDAILLDLTLHESSGVRTVRVCREKRPKDPIVVVTHESDRRLHAKCLNAGADWYLRKGCTTEDILEGVRTAIAARAIARGGEQSDHSITTAQFLVKLINHHLEAMRNSVAGLTT